MKVALRVFIGFVLIFSVKLWLYAESASGVEAMYRSTDFEVHRGWKAITSQSQFDWLETSSNSYSPTGVYFGTLRYWYREDTSLWTLDYPMLFAYFEWVLSQLARTPLVVNVFFGGNSSDVDAALAITRIDSITGIERRLDPSVSFVSQGIIDFQRATVLLFSDVPFVVLMLLVAPNCVTSPTARRGALMFSWIALNPGHVIIDNIHFQYNGMLFAIFFIVICFAQRRRTVATAATFVVLVLFKHLFAYYVFGFAVWGAASLVSCGTSRLRLVISVLVASASIAALAILPFVLSEAQRMHCLSHPDRCTAANSSSKLAILQEVITHSNHVELFKQSLVEAVEPIKMRLFPFGRGLCHAYWAPNAYALYSALDLVLCRLATSDGAIGKAAKSLDSAGWHRLCGNTSVNTRGIVGLTAEHVSHGPTHAFLFNVTPAGSLACVILCFLLILVPLLYRVRTRCGSWRSVSKWLSSSHGLLALCFASSAAFFMFSWHVHEKAWLTVVLPLTVVALESSSYVAATSQVGSARSKRGAFFGIYAAVVLTTIPSLFPLLHTYRENVIKYVMYGTSTLSFVLLLAPREMGSFRKGLLVGVCIGFTVLSMLVDRNPETFLFLMVMSCVECIAVVVAIVQVICHFPILPDRKDF